MANKYETNVPKFQRKARKQNEEANIISSETVNTYSKITITWVHDIKGADQGETVPSSTAT